MWTNYLFQEPGNTKIEDIIWVHEVIILEFTFIFIVFIVFIILSVFNNNSSRLALASQRFEAILGVGPGIALIPITSLSVESINAHELYYNTLFSLHVVGAQWCWTYDYYFGSGAWLSITSNILTSCDTLWCLDVDNRAFFLQGWSYQILGSSIDVIHSWSVPGLGVNIDVLPGRLNECYLSLDYPGVYFGQCSEICGAYHSFMPIVVESVV